MTKPERTPVLSAGVVVLRPSQPENPYLLLRVYNYWDFPKGQVENGEDPLDTACREVAEETSLTQLEFRWGHEYRETEPYRGGKVARYYVAAAEGETVRLGINPELGRPEHHEFRWLSHAGARARLVPRLVTILDWAHGLVANGGSSQGG